MSNAEITALHRQLADLQAQKAQYADAAPAQLVSEIGDLQRQLDALEMAEYLPQRGPEYKVWVVNHVQGQGDFTTISEAIKQANAGDTILVKPGEYRESLEISKNLEVVGDGPREQIILKPYTPFVLEITAHRGRIANLTIANDGTMHNSSCIEIMGGQILIEQCDLSGAYNAVLINQQGQALIRGCLIHDCNTGVQVNDSSHAIMRNNDLFNHHDECIFVTAQSTALIQDNYLRDSQDGVAFFDEANGTVERNLIFNHTNAGILVDTATKPTFQYNQIHHTATAILANSGIFIANQLYANGENWNITTDEPDTITRQANQEGVTADSIAQDSPSLVNSSQSNSKIDALKQRLVELQKAESISDRGNLALDVAEVQRQIADLELAEYQFQRTPDQKVWVVKNEQRGFFASMSNLFKRNSAPANAEIEHTEYYATINEAIERAKDGDTILIKPGEYKEALNIDKNLEIVGDGPLDQIILRRGYEIGLKISAQRVRIAHLTIKSTDHIGRCIEITRGHALIEQCDLDNADIAVVLNEDAHAVIRDCLIHDGNFGIEMHDASYAIIRSNDIFEHKQTCISMGDQTTAIIQDNTLRDAQEGLALTDIAYAIVERNTLVNHDSSAIICYTTNHSLFRDNQIHDSAVGIGLSATHASLIGNHLYDNGANWNIDAEDDSVLVRQDNRES